MAKTDEDERRRYERIDGAGAVAVLRVPGREVVRTAIINISRGGVALRTDSPVPAGTAVQMELPGAGEPVAARVARSHDGSLVLAFRQDAAMLRQVDAALEHIDGSAGTRAAA